MTEEFDYDKIYSKILKEAEKNINSSGYDPNKVNSIKTTIKELSEIKDLYNNKSNDLSKETLKILLGRLLATVKFEAKRKKVFIKFLKNNTSDFIRQSLISSGISVGTYALITFVIAQLKEFNTDQRFRIYLSQFFGIILAIPLTVAVIQTYLNWKNKPSIIHEYIILSIEEIIEEIS